MDKCRESPPTDWPAAAYILLGRQDLALSCSSHSRQSKELEPHTKLNLVSMSTPYMQHLHPVTIPSSVSGTIGLENTKLEDTDSVDGITTDGMEHIFNSSTQLRYGRDLRLNEVSYGPLRIVNNFMKGVSKEVLKKHVKRLFFAGKGSRCLGGYD